MDNIICKQYAYKLSWTMVVYIILLGAINAQLPRRHCDGSPRYRLTYYYSNITVVPHVRPREKSHDERRHA